MPLEQLRREFEQHKAEDAARFDYAIQVESNLTQTVDRLIKEVQDWRKDQIKMSELIRKTNDEVANVKKFFSEENLSNLRSVVEWVSAARYWKYFMILVIGILVMISQGLGAWRSITNFFGGR